MSYVKDRYVTSKRGVGADWLYPTPLLLALTGYTAIPPPYRQQNSVRQVPFCHVAFL